MGKGRRRVTAVAVVAGAAAAGGAALAAGGLTSAGSANAKVPGKAAPNSYSPQLQSALVATGANRLENPTATIGFYGYLNDGPHVPAPGDVQAPGHNVEATKTEPDKNTYLVLPGQHGPDGSYGYGTHFLYQGHEHGAGYITRINLDANGDHRATLLASQDTLGNPLPTFDGSTWDPFANRLLFSYEAGTSGGVWQATPDYPSTVNDLSGHLGRGGYEGMQLDPAGQVWIVEDVGGPTGSIANNLNNAKQPNSFIYRFVPTSPTDLTQGGRLQALQVISNRTNTPIVFHAGQADADITSPDVQDLHTYGLTFTTHWVTVHTSSPASNAPFDANAAAKAANATPFKRPENGVFRPDTGFGEFYFTETGDTNAASQANASFGGFGGLFRLSQASPTANDGTLTLFYKGDLQHTGFDNIQFLRKNQMVAVEDAGDGMHTSRNALDSAYLFDTRTSGPQDPVRIIAEGRDPSATIDSGLISISGNGFQNEGDNEITGFHVSDGDPTTAGLLGAGKPTPFAHGYRVFWTQQHGDNNTWELRQASRHASVQR